MSDDDHIVDVVALDVKRKFADIVLSVNESDTIIDHAVRYALSLSEFAVGISREKPPSFYGVVHDTQCVDTKKQRVTMIDACYIRVVMDRDIARNETIDTVAQLLAEFPELSVCSDQEDLSGMLVFRNALKVALLIINPVRNRDRLWEIACRFETIDREYKRGSMQRPSVTWREIIFERVLSATSGKKVSRPNQYTRKKRKLEDAAAVAIAADALLSL